MEAQGKVRNAWVSAGGQRCLYGHQISPPSPASFPLFFDLASSPPLEISEDLRYFQLLSSYLSL